MNDLSEAYRVYSSADKILELLNSRKDKNVKRVSLKKTPYWKTVINLLVAYKFISLQGNGKQQMLLLTEKGLEHLQNGGFGDNFVPPREVEKKKTFKQHLDELTSLLTIFGILNSVILFASQVKGPNTPDPKGLNLNLTGVEFVSISMYLLSLVVLWEIIWTTLKEAQDNFKFKTLYFLLCSTTIGIGVLFLNQYNQLIYDVIYIFGFFAVIGAIFWLLKKLLLLFVTKKNAVWYSKYSKNVTFSLLIASLILAAIILKLVLSLILKK